MSLRLIRISGGAADLGEWGAVALTGAASAVVKARRAPDLELAEGVAKALVDAALLLDDAEGRLLVLPYAGEVVARIELEMSEEQLSLLSIPRDPDVGMRLAHLQLLEEGVLFMTERSLLQFDRDLQPAWWVDEDFSGWDFEAVEADAIRLVSSDWSGHEKRQLRSRANGLRAD